MMNKYNFKNSRACMIRGKAVEETIRFYYENLGKMSLTQAQNFANDLYHLKTVGLPSKIINLNAKPINAIVKAGVTAFKDLNIKKVINFKSYKLFKKKKNRTVFPDFKIDKMSLKKKSFKSSCVELKVVKKLSFNLINKHAKQCYNYSINGRKPVILLYIIYEESSGKHAVYKAKYKIYVVSKR